MTALRQRRSEMEQALREQKLLGNEETLPRQDIQQVDPPTPMELLNIEKVEHALKVIGFSDGSTMVMLMTRSTEPTFIALLASPPDAAWRVQVAANLPERCSELLLRLWNKMPERKNNKSGLFTEDNGRLALTNLLKSFAVS